ncbi:uncharacterized protein LOC133178777 [Saccostrea echinata]|uniref:uncharacterized protein LOC133178777 n=1 Tax=Saccostrea echinata TaxID=191078 RepID=UPI002A8407AE|nr:uncharacterized protein LOC133178777 [Saccostrea echinata]
MTLENMAKDPMHQLFGDSEVTKLCRVVMCLSGVHKFFLDIFTDIFSVGKTLCSTLDREYMFQKFHQTRVSDDFIRGYMLLFATLTFTGQATCICDFLNILMMELIGNLISEQVKRGLKNAVAEQERISDSDQCILFYICGFNVRSLRKRYLKVKSVCPQKQQC